MVSRRMRSDWYGAKSDPAHAASDESIIWK